MLLTIGLNRLGRILENRYQTMCQERFGVSGSDVRLLLALRRSGKPFARRPTDLFRALIMTSGAITKQVDRLEEKNLVARIADPRHAGGFLVHLTTKGLKMVDVATKELSANSVIADAMAALSTEEREGGFRLIEHLLREVEET